MDARERLRTPRLILREADEADAPFLLDLLNEPGFTQNIGDRGVRTLDDARGYVATALEASYRANGFGLWITTFHDGEPAGICGLIRRDGLDHPDIGYAFVERVWGQGLASEAAAATLDHGRRVLGMTTIVAITAPGNAPSQAVLRKIGLRFAGTIRVAGQQSDSAYFTT